MLSAANMEFPRGDEAYRTRELASLQPGSSSAESRKVEPMQCLRSLHVEAAIPRWKCSDSGRTVKAVDDCRAGQSRGVRWGDQDDDL